MTRFALFVLLIFSASTIVFSQQAANATLTGTITDPHRAVVSGASVTATQKATGFTTKVSKTDVSLNVGQTVTVNVPLEIGVTESVILDLDPTPPLIDNSDSLIHGIINSREVESLPLNGRNFLELALLIPGNAPAPNFDPTKTNTVLISSAGQLGRGGNVTIDGVDTNDDVVGGSIQNISQEAVQEFQIATNRFSAELGRSGSSVINIVTRSGANDLHGSASIFFRDSSLQGLPATFDRTLDQSPPFDRQQYAFAVGGPIKKDRAWFFGSFENRNQDGVVLVGNRDLATRSIRRGFADAPLDDFMTTERVDFRPNTSDEFTF